MRISLFILLQISMLFAADRSSADPADYVFTTQVLKIDRTVGKIILSYSEGGKDVVAVGKSLTMENYDDLAKQLLVTVTKVHESKPWVIVEVSEGDYSKIETSFRYKTRQTPSTK